MSDFLNQQIEAAREAARMIAEADAQRALAEQLPFLEQQAQLEQQRQQAKANFQAAKIQARELLASAKPGVADWQKRFVAAVAELEQLMAELPQVQEPIFQAGRTLRKAAHDQALFSEAYAKLGALAGDGMNAAWEQVGGTDPALEVLPTKPPSDFFLKLVQALKIRVYLVRDWHRFF